MSTFTLYRNDESKNTDILQLFCDALEIKNNQTHMIKQLTDTYIRPIFKCMIDYMKLEHLEPKDLYHKDYKLHQYLHKRLHNYETVKDIAIEIMRKTLFFLKSNDQIITLIKYYHSQFDINNDETRLSLYLKCYKLKILDKIEGPLFCCIDSQMKAHFIMMYANLIGLLE